MTDLPPTYEPPPKTSETSLFWVALFAPAVLALVTFLLSRDVSALGVIVGIGALIVGIISTFYCGFWLAARFCKSKLAYFITAVGLVLLLGIVNLIIVCAGCAAIVL
jgi:hypothetical protein